MQLVINHLRQIEFIVGGHALGWLLVFAIVAAYLGSIGFLVGALFKRPSHVALVVTMCAAGLSAFVGGLRVAQERAVAVGLLMKARSAIPDLSQHSRRFSEAYGQILTSVHWVTLELVVVSFVVLFAIIRRRPRGLWGRFFLFASILGLLSALTLFVGNERLFEKNLWCGDLGGNKSLCAFEVVTESLKIFQFGKCALWCIGSVLLAAFCFLASRDAMSERLASRRDVIAATAILLAGLVAFVSTRAKGLDAEHLVPPDADNVGACLVFDELRELLPQSREGCTDYDTEFVEFRSGRAVVHGEPVTSPTQLETRLVHLRTLLKEISPGIDLDRRIVVIAASRDSIVKELRPWLEAVHRAGYSTIANYMTTPVVIIPTATLGTIEKVRCCARSWKIVSSAGRSFSQFRTWGEITDAALSDSLELSID